MRAARNVAFALSELTRRDAAFADACLAQCRRTDKLRAPAVKAGGTIFLQSRAAVPSIRRLSRHCPQTDGPNRPSAL